MYLRELNEMRAAPVSRNVADLLEFSSPATLAGQRSDPRRISATTATYLVQECNDLQTWIPAVGAGVRAF